MKPFPFFPFVLDAPPPRGMNRLWVWGPTFFAGNWGLAFGVGVYMLRFRGKWQRPFVTHDLKVGIDFNPRRWNFQTHHFWYDGPNCAWNFGPFYVYRDGFWCQRCYDETFGPEAQADAPRPASGANGGEG